MVSQTLNHRVPPKTMSQSEDTTTVDRISDLSNEILCHILSFLPIKQAFTTTLLSKRWASLCYLLTVLSFDDDDYDTSDQNLSSFYRFIDTLMLSPTVSNQFIKTFRLKCRSIIYNNDGKSFHAWVEAAKRRRVEEFDLRMNNNTLNPTIFTSRTLVVLKLEKVHVEAETLCVDLPSLKTLHLKFVRFENQNDIKRLLNACPNLHDLHTCYPSFIRREENNEADEFKSLFLSKLFRADVGSIDVPFNSICNVEYLRMIRAQEPSLEMNVEEIFKGIPVFQNLIHVELWFYGFFHGWDGVVELLRHCPKLQIVFIRKWNTGLSKDWDIPILDVKCVSSHLRSCTILNFDGSDNDLRFSRYILQNASLLQDMTINGTTSSSNGLEKHQVIEELSSCPRMSQGCELSFEFK